MPSFFLAKTDPETYSVAQFAAEKQTLWDGVTNAQAVAVIRSMRLHDRVWIYHSMGQSAIVGLAKVISAPQPDPNNPKSAVVRLEFLKPVDPPVTLHDIKSSGLFAGWALIRQSRLSTMAAPPEFQDWIRLQRPKLKF
jgi:predicted RNA-binding protein with PUA-like domain